jgi:hypothetical protein
MNSQWNHLLYLMNFWWCILYIYVSIYKMFRCIKMWKTGLYFNYIKCIEGLVRYMQTIETNERKIEISNMNFELHHSIGECEMKISWKCGKCIRLLSWLWFFVQKIYRHIHTYNKDKMKTCQDNVATLHNYTI